MEWSGKGLRNIYLDGWMGFVMVDNGIALYVNRAIFIGEKLFSTFLF